MLSWLESLSFFVVRPEMTVLDKTESISIRTSDKRQQIIIQVHSDNYLSGRVPTPRSTAGMRGTTDMFYIGTRATAKVD